MKLCYRTSRSEERRPFPHQTGHDLTDFRRQTEVSNGDFGDSRRASCESSRVATPTILVIDDVDDTRELWALAFRKAGFRVLVADSCATALRVLREERGIDFVVTDYWLGDGSCESVLRTAVHGGDLRNGAALICTALPSLEKSSYAAGVVHKPIVTEELIERVRELLSPDTQGVA